MESTSAKTRQPERTPACQLDELTDGAARLVTVRGRKIALTRIGDAVYALQDACPHFGGPLSDGTVSVARKELICPWHRFRFELGSGCSVTNRELVAPSYPVTVENGHVYITL